MSESDSTHQPKSQIIERTQLEVSLRDSETRYREIFDDAPVALSVEDWSPVKNMIDKLSPEGGENWRAYFMDHRDRVIEAYDLVEILEVSNACLDLYGKKSVQEYLDASQGALVLPEELDAFVEVLLGFIEGRWQIDIESLDTKSDGSEIIIRSRGVIPPAHRHDWSRLIYSLEDITERRKIEQQLRQAQKMEAVGQLTGGVAHDFNNILTVITGNLELMSDHLDASSNMSNMIERCMKSAERGATLTQQLLSFSRNQLLQPAAVDINELASDMKELLVRAFGETIEIDFDGPADLWRCDADPTQLQNALLNLSINARDAMPSGGRLKIATANITLDEKISTARLEISPGQYVTLSVSDTGSGIEKETLEHVIEPFFTTKEVGKGSGLGLSMVYGFAKQSGGTLTIHSELDQGTTVILYLPRSAGHGDETAIEETTSLSTGAIA